MKYASIAPKIGAIINNHNDPIFCPDTSAGPILLAGLIDAPVKGIASI
jgi:hypothetical protein